MKRLVIVIFIIFGAFLTFSLYRTFAYDTSVVEETPSTTDLEYTFKIGNSSIKQITVDSGETKYFDVVLGNPNPAKISYGVYYEMVSPSIKPDGFSIEYTSKSTGESTGKVDKEGNITLNIEVTNTSSSAVTVKIGSVAGYVNGGDLILGSGQVLIPEKKIPATSIIEALDDGTTGDDGSGVYKVEHDAIASGSSATGSDIKATTDYRYYGASPNNYICLDMEGGSTCPDKHLYRIMGSIYEELEDANRLKVIKATPLTNGITSEFSWDYTSSGSYSNVWATITSGNYSNSLSSGSQLMQLLNSGAWWKGTSGSYYNGSKKSTTVNFTNYKLSDKAKSYITISRYYLGGFDATSYSPSEIYKFERGNKRLNSDRPLYWDGIVGLMYSSDYGYASGIDCAGYTTLNSFEKCYLNNWIFKSLLRLWTINPTTDNYDKVWYVDKSGNVYYSDYTVGYPNYVFPVFYLTSDVSITSGTGTSTDPYLVTK